ncbi:MAG: class I adenylate-forming enzyme family protein [Acidimicrobiaceae bacterium]|nr:class I adenylate-forming enzyme family protein [Acidimicrobiaceae bacterium]
MSLRNDLIQGLTGPEGYFPVQVENVLGFDVPVLTNRRKSLRDLVEGCRAHGDREFLVLGDRRISHDQFVDLVAAEAVALSADHGVAKGDCVGILAANSPDWVIAYFALVSSGAIVALYNGWWTPDEIVHATELTTPKLILGDEKRLARVPESVSAPQIDIDAERERLQRDAGAHQLPTVELAEDDPVSIFFTSGTTGRAKGATASHRGLVGFVEIQMLNGAVRMMQAAAEAEAAGQPPPPPSGGPPIVMMTSPLFHVSGLSGSTLINMVAGGTLIFRTGRFDPAAGLRLVERERITVWSLIGSMGPRVLDEAAKGLTDTSSLTNVGFGGAPVSPDLAQRVRDVLPTAAANVGIGYGSSETVGVVASHGGADMVARPEAAGWVLPTMQVQIRDDAGTVLPDGKNGRIWVKSAYTMLGYWNDDKATAEAVDEDFWLDTGDVGRLEDQVLTIDSRARDMILHNGENVYPIEVEYRIEDHPDVSEVAVYGLDDELTGQVVAASVVPTPGAALSADGLRTWAAKSLAPYKVPTSWDIRSERLPRNAAGKVVKDALSGQRAFTALDD